MSDSTPKMCDVRSALIGLPSSKTIDSKHFQNCYTGGILTGEPKGVMIKVAGLDCYVAEGTSTEKAIVL